MTHDERKILLEFMAALSAYYQRPLPDMVLKMYADDLNDLPFNDVMKAYDRYRKDPKNRAMPLPAQIRGILEPSLDQDQAAREILARITQAVDKFGYTWPHEAKEFIGDIGWSVVQAYGGWQKFCQGLGDEFSVDMFNAQGRELLKTRLSHGVGIGEKVAAIPYSEKPMEEIGNKLDYHFPDIKLLEQFGLKKF